MQNQCDSVRPTQTRKIKPTRRSVSGVYPFRGETATPYESTLERDFLIRKEFSLCVLDIIPQPVQIPFTSNNGRVYTYTPDFLVYYRIHKNASHAACQKPVLIEVKPESEWRKNWRQWMPKWKAAYRYAKEQGWEFHIHDESRIRDIAFENISFLAIYQRMNFAIEETRWVLDNVRSMGVAPFHYIMARHFMGSMFERQGKAHIWNLLATRQLDCDMTRPLDDFTELWIPINE